MKFSGAIILALASSAFAVTQNCKKAGLAPYCCDSVWGGGSEMGFSVGMNCQREAYGTKTSCASSNQQKQCCEINATSFGPITMCQGGF